MNDFSDARACVPIELSGPFLDGLHRPLSLWTLDGIKQSCCGQRNERRCEQGGEAEVEWSIRGEACGFRKLGLGARVVLVARILSVVVWGSDYPTPRSHLLLRVTSNFLMVALFRGVYKNTCM